MGLAEVALMWTGVALAGATVGFLASTRRRNRAAAWLSGAVSVCGFAVAFLVSPFVLFALITWRVTFAEWFLPRVAENGDRIVAALRAYEADHGRRPQTLDDLVPQYLERIPPTGCPADDTWHYWPAGATWELSVGVNGPDPFSYDEIVYDPTGMPEPPARISSRHGDWCYLNVHD